jgi:hypothetical protein
LIRIGLFKDDIWPKLEEEVTGEIVQEYAKNYGMIETHDAYSSIINGVKNEPVKFGNSL